MYEKKYNNYKITSDIMKSLFKRGGVVHMDNEVVFVCLQFYIDKWGVGCLKYYECDDVSDCQYIYVTSQYFF